MSARNLNISLWAAQILLAMVFGAAGFMKVTMPLPDLAAMLTWPGNVPSWLVRFIGTAELAGAIGILVPALTRIQPLLTPLAALGFAIIQILAVPVHISQGDIAMVGPINAILLALALFVVWGRYRKLPIQPKAALT
ncbi:DoxX family protein [Mesorhizobium sp. KR9-304]|uniref:DoxX family protein n=1 Tax=Mesorhizobium sp. KR9-304 TaxID=3156614 RepID=UPI0032B548A5